MKLRAAGDEDLIIDLNAEVSRLLRTYLNSVRAKALRPGDEENPYLFPSQGEKAGLAQPYGAVLKRVCRWMDKVVGIKMNPHCFRHLLGLIWLKEDPGCLHRVQCLLGHKSMVTTITYYIEFQEEEVQAEWEKIMAKRSSRSRSEAEA